MTAEQPLYLQGSGSLNYDAVMMRTMLNAFLGGRSFESLSAGTGAVGRGHGVLTSSSLEVTANSTPNNSVKVSPGIASVRGTQSDEQGIYLCPLRETHEVQISDKDDSDTRIDFVVAQIRDDAYAALTQDDWTPDVVEGTPGGGDPSVPDDCLVLARVTVDPGTGSTNIGNGDIDDLRTHARPTGGITPVNTTSDFPDPVVDDFVWDDSSDSLLRYDGSSWMTVSKNLDTPWQSYGTTASRWNDVSIGFDGTSYAIYGRQGQTVIGVAGFELGWGGGVDGLFTLNLPTVADTNFPGLCAGRCWDASEEVFYSGIGFLTSSTTIGNYGTAGGLVWRTNIPITWTGADHMRTFFMYKEA